MKGIKNTLNDSPFPRDPQWEKAQALESISQSSTDV